MKLILSIGAGVIIVALVVLTILLGSNLSHADQKVSTLERTLSSTKHSLAESQKDTEGCKSQSAAWQQVAKDEEQGLADSAQADSDILNSAALANDLANLHSITTQVDTDIATAQSINCDGSGTNS